MKVKLVKIRYIDGPRPGFEHVMKKELALVLERRGQIEIVKESSGKKGKAGKGKEPESSEEVPDSEESDKE